MGVKICGNFRSDAELGDPTLDVLLCRGYEMMKPSLCVSG
jgi:hypothetical protein